MRWLYYPTKRDLELKLTHIDRDKGGHKAHDLESSRNFSFSHFTQGITFILLWQSSLDEKRLFVKIP